MQKLIGEIIQVDKIIRRSEKTFESNVEFFIALVSICEELAIDVPFWTYREDLQLKRNKKVELPYNKKGIIKISVS